MRVFKVKRAVSRSIRGAAAAALHATTALTAGITFAPGPAHAQAVRSYEIPAGSLATALNRFIEASGATLVYDAALTNGLSSPGVKGRFGAAEALSHLLAGSGLTFRQTGANAYTLERAPVSANGAIQLGPVRVEGAGAASGGTPFVYAIDDPGRTEGNPDYAPPSSNSSFKIPMTLQETPQTVVVVPQAIIRDFNLTDVREVLEFTPGIITLPERSNQYFVFQSRGFLMQTQYDGVPSPNGMGARGKSLAADTAIVDRVEVLQGASGLLAGSGAPGGVVNIMRKMPTSTFQLGAQAGIDSWGGWRGVLDVSTPIGDGFGVRLVGVLERRDSFTEYVSGVHAVVYGVVEKKLGENTTIALGATFDEVFDYSPGAHYGLPLRIDGDYSAFRRKQNLGAAWADQKDSGHNVFLRAQHDFGGNWRGQALITREKFKTNSLQSVAAADGTNPFGPPIFYSQTEVWENTSWSADLNLVGDLNLLGGDHQLMIGFNGAWSNPVNGGYQRCPAIIASIDLATWDARNAPVCPAPLFQVYGAYDDKIRNIGLFAGGRFEIVDSLHLLLGSRLSWYRAASDGVASQRENAVFTPYGALTWAVTDFLTAYGSYTDVFQPHDVGTIDGTGKTLPPKVGESKEIGLKLSLLDGDLLGQLNYHWNSQTNIAVPDTASTVPGRCGGPLLPGRPCFAASGKVPAQGWDISVQGRVLPGLQVIAGYSHSETNVPVYNPFAGTSQQAEFGPTNKNSWNVAVSYTSPDSRWNVGVSAKYQSGYYNSQSIGPITLTIDEKPFTIVAINARYDITDSISASVKVENLLNKKYFAPQFFYPNPPVWGDPRQATFTLRATL